MKIRGNFGCSNYDMVKFKILKEVIKIVLRSAAFVLFRASHVSKPTSSL